MLPRSLSLVGDKDLHAVSVDVGEDVELAVVVAYARSPYALSVSLLAVFEAELVAKSEEVLHRVAAEAPVDEVLGVKHHHSWQAVHRCTGEVVVLSHPYHVGVGELVVKQRVGVSAIAVVG